MEKRNQFLNCNSLLLEVSAKTKKKSAYLKLAVPDELAEKLLKQISLQQTTPIQCLQLAWLDGSLTVDKESKFKAGDLVKHKTLYKGCSFKVLYFDEDDCVFKAEYRSRNLLYSVSILPENDSWEKVNDNKKTIHKNG